MLQGYAYPTYSFFIFGLKEIGQSFRFKEMIKMKMVKSPLKNMC